MDNNTQKPVDVDNVIKNILNGVVDQTTIKYYSEASVQMKIGIEIYKQLEVEPVLEKLVNSGAEAEMFKAAYLDIYFEYNDCRFGIELKYKTTSVDGEAYKNQGAQNNGKYDYLFDLSRIEKMIDQEEIHKGYAILITNDHTYWKKAREGAQVEPFNLHESWRRGSASVSDCGCPSIYEPNWKGRSPGIEIKHDHKLTWYGPEPANQHQKVFRYCIAEIGPCVPTLNESVAL